MQPATRHRGFELDSDLEDGCSQPGSQRAEAAAPVPASSGGNATAVLASTGGGNA